MNKLIPVAILPIPAVDSPGFRSGSGRIGGVTWLVCAGPFGGPIESAMRLSLSRVPDVLGEPHVGQCQ